MFRKVALEQVDHFKNITKISGDTMVIVKILSMGDFAQIQDVLFDFRNFGGALRELNSSNGTAFKERLEMITKLEDFAHTSEKCCKALKEYDFIDFRKSFVRQSFSLNGSAVWLASHFKGSYFEKVKLIIIMFLEGIRIEPSILLSVVTYIVLFSCLVFPPKLFFLLAKIYSYQNK